MIDEEKISQEYIEHEQAFARIANDLHESLKRIANIFYEKTRFRPKIEEPRLKTLGSILGKLKRKGRDADALLVRNDDQLSLVVNDFLGARIICNTREDVEEIMGLIEQHQRFKIIKPERFDLNPKPSGYRAVHLDVLYRSYLNDDLIYIPVEIQIKTHLQNAWADITHDESYKPESNDLTNEWEREYSKHMADILDVLDNMASTIRKQRLSFVKPPNMIDDSITLINANTLSYKIDAIKKGERLTQQEMALAISRLKEEGFETLAEITDLLHDETIKGRIENAKEELRTNETARPFEMLYYGPLLRRGKESKFEEEIQKDYGFVPYHCRTCSRLITEDEYQFIKTKTDSDEDYYCGDHRSQYFNKTFAHDAAIDIRGTV